jgi:magnesium chelatase family protein
MREPLQNGEIHLHRIGTGFHLPAEFTLIAAMNPCPCGYSMGGGLRCRCPRERVLGYRKRISGPMLDRFDLAVVLGPPKSTDGATSGYSHAEVRDRVRSCRDLRRARGGGGFATGLAALAAEERAWMARAIAEGRTSYRGLDQVLRVARTVADLAGEEEVRVDHLREAWSFRCTELFSSV